MKSLRISREIGRFPSILYVVIGLSFETVSAEALFRLGMNYICAINHTRNLDRARKP